MADVKFAGFYINRYEVCYCLWFAPQNTKLNGILGILRFAPIKDCGLSTEFIMIFVGMSKLRTLVQMLIQEEVNVPLRDIQIQ